MGPIPTPGVQTLSDTTPLRMTVFPSSVKSLSQVPHLPHTHENQLFPLDRAVLPPPQEEEERGFSPSRENLPPGKRAPPLSNYTPRVSPSSLKRESPPLLPPRKLPSMKSRFCEFRILPKTLLPPEGPFPSLLPFSSLLTFQIPVRF